MEKQHNRGQDGAGVVSLKFGLPPGQSYLDRHRSNNANPIKKVFDLINRDIHAFADHPKFQDTDFARQNIPFIGDIYLGHLRYGTFGKNSKHYLHPVMRVNNWKSRTLSLAGNFNLTNVDELFQELLNYGQHPKDFTDTVTMLEMIGLHMDEANQKLFRHYKNNGYNNRQISDLIPEKLDIAKILHESSQHWDGGYAVCGMLGHGDIFVNRDPWGIRPAYYYCDDEIVVAASERPVIQTTMNVAYEDVKELKPGHALIVSAAGKITEKLIRIPQEKKSCSFERIYFSRGSDKDIYRERKKLGELIVPTLLEKLNHDFENSVFSYIPNTAEPAFYGMVKGLEDVLMQEKTDKIRKHASKMSSDDMIELLMERPRVEKIAVKDVKLRTFISKDEGRDDLVGHVYDITYGTVKAGKDNLVVIDDSIVRGTTLRESILRILNRLQAKHIIIISSAPQIRYPDCYGIDMAKLGDFVAFQAAVSLLKEKDRQDVLQDTYEKCKAQQNLPKDEIFNYVKDVYKPFTADEISERIAELLTPNDIDAKVSIIYQSIENLHKACPNHTGDWYFTGDYPTPGGNRVVNNSFINYMEGRNQRSY